MNKHSSALIVKNAVDWAKKASDGYFCRYTRFLDEYQQAEAVQALERMGFSGYELYGGYEGAERKLLCVYGNAPKPEPSDYPIYAVTYRYKTSPGRELSHRDFLGAFMTLNISRECIGDIVVDDGVCVSFSTLPVIRDVTKVGRTGVEACDGCEALLGIDTGSRFSEAFGTVASLRLDCIVAFAARISRSAACEAISMKRVCVNGVVCTDESRRICEGSVVSVRGKGKFRLDAVGEQTLRSRRGGQDRVGRIHITVKKYI